MKAGAAEPVNGTVEAVLADGTKILFRRIRPDDKNRLREGMERLSPESRYRRFFSPIKQLGEAQLRYLTEVDFTDHFAVLGVLGDTEGEPAVGVARWIRTQDDATIADAAVTVLDSYQRRGVGRSLLQLLARTAIERGVRSFKVDVLSENHDMTRLMQGVGAIFERTEAGVVAMRVPLPATVELLEETPASAILRATAAGQLQGEARAGGRGTRFHAGN